MQYYISITIGRNIGLKTREVKNKWARNRPMNTDSWKNFRRTIKLILEDACTVAGVVFDGIGEGVWVGVEDAYNLAVIVSDYDREKLRHELYMAGADFAQDAITLVVVPLPQGDETLIDCT